MAAAMYIVGAVEIVLVREYFLFSFSFFKYFFFTFNASTFPSILSMQKKKKTFPRLFVHSMRFHFQMNELKCNISSFFSFLTFSFIFILLMCWICNCLQTYMAPIAAVFVDKDDPESAMYNNFRLYGSCLLLIMGMYTHWFYSRDYSFWNIAWDGGWLRDHTWTIVDYKYLFYFSNVQLEHFSNVQQTMKNEKQNIL